LLGWQAKPTLATFPAAFLLCAFAVRQAPLRRLLAASAPFWLVSAIFSARLLAGVQGTTHAGFGIPQLSAGRYFLTEARVVLTYLRLLIAPVGQNADWDFAPSVSLFEPLTLAAFAVIAGMLAGAILLWRWSRQGEGEERTAARLAAFGIFWF